MKRILHNSDLGFYTQTFFRIHLYKNVTFNHMSEEDYAVLAHKYIHFLQDISTTYGAFMAYSSSEYMRSCSGHQRRNRDVSLFFMPSTGFVCHAVASRGSATAQVPLGKFK